MPTYKAPLRDMRFVLHELLDVAQIAELPGYAEATPDLVDSILDEAAKLAEEVLAPLNRAGDEEGCRYENGVVTAPPSFKAAYDTFVEEGWTSLAGDRSEEHTSELKSLMRTQTAVFCLKKKK